MSMNSSAGHIGSSRFLFCIRGWRIVFRTLAENAPIHLLALHKKTVFLYSQLGENLPQGEETVAGHLWTARCQMWEVV